VVRRAIPPSDAARRQIQAPDGPVEVLVPDYHPYPLKAQGLTALPTKEIEK
jgi:hypothetical protein